MCLLAVHVSFAFEQTTPQIMPKMYLYAAAWTGCFYLSHQFSKWQWNCRLSKLSARMKQFPVEHPWKDYLSSYLLTTKTLCIVSVLHVLPAFFDIYCMSGTVKPEKETFTCGSFLLLRIILVSHNLQAMKAWCTFWMRIVYFSDHLICTSWLMDICLRFYFLLLVVVHSCRGYIHSFQKCLNMWDSFLSTPLFVLRSSQKCVSWQNDRTGSVQQPVARSSCSTFKVVECINVDRSVGQ